MIGSLLRPDTLEITYNRWGPILQFNIEPPLPHKYPRSLTNQPYAPLFFSSQSQVPVPTGHLPPPTDIMQRAVYRRPDANPNSVAPIVPNANPALPPLDLTESLADNVRPFMTNEVADVEELPEPDADQNT